MKKTVFLVLALIAFAAAPALCQEVKGSEAKAIVHLDKGELDMAKKEIEAFFDNPKNVKKVVKGKPWATKARIYKAIAISDKPEFQSLLDNPVQATLECFNKVKEYEKEGSLVYTEIFGSAPELQGTPLFQAGLLEEFYGDYFNKGVEAFNNNDYKTAMESFENVLLIKPTDTNAALNVVIASYNLEEPNLKKVKEYSRKMIALGYTKADPYKYVAQIELQEANEEIDAAQNASDSATILKKFDDIAAFVQEGRAKFPGDQDLLNMLINTYVVTNKTDNAIASMEEAAANNPDKVLYYNLGILYERTKQLDKAVASYQKSLEIDPAYTDADYNLGAMYYNTANKKKVEAGDHMDMNGKITDEAGKKLMAEAKDNFAKAIPHFERVHRAKPDERQPVDILYRLYLETENKVKMKEMEKKLEKFSDEGE